MITPLHLIFLVFAVALFAIAALVNWFIEDPRVNKINLIAVGLFFYALKDLFQ